MGYVDTNLIPGEQIVHRGRLTRALLVPGIVLLPFIVGALPLAVELIRRATTEMAVTNKRVMFKTGLVSRRTIEMNLAKVEHITVDQGLFGRGMDFGTITVVGTGGSRETFKWVAAPLEFRRAVQEQIDARL